MKHKGPDALSRRPGTEGELREVAEGGEVAVQRVEEFEDGELDAMWVSAEEEEACTGFCNSVFHSFSILFPMLRRGEGERGDAVGFCLSFNKAMYEGEENLQRMGEYLETMRRRAGMPDGEFKRFKGFAVKFLQRDGVLYRHVKTGMPPRRVLGNTTDDREVLCYGPLALYTFPTPYTFPASTYLMPLNPLPYFVHVPLFKSPHLTLIT